MLNLTLESVKNKLFVINYKKINSNKIKKLLSYIIFRQIKL